MVWSMQDSECVQEMGEKAIDDQQGSSVVITNIKETSGPLNQLNAGSHCVCLEGNNVT